VSRRSHPQEQSSGRRVAVRLPPWLGGNDIIQYVNDAGLKATPIDASTFHWQLETRESYERRPPCLVSVCDLAGPGQLARWERPQSVADPGISSPMPLDQLLAERDRILGRNPGDFTAVASALRLTVSTVRHADMAQAAREGHDALVGLKDSEEAPLFQQLSCRFGFSPVVMRRLALARLLMQIDEEPALLTQRPIPAPGEIVFGSGWHLSSDLALSRDAYFAPLFLSASPWVWSIVCARIPGLILYDLGRCVVGRLGEAAEMLQIFFPPGRLASGHTPPISSTHTTAATTWWVGQIDKVLSELSDFSNYCDSRAGRRRRPWPDDHRGSQHGLGAYRKAEGEKMVWAMITSAHP
jgi:hypothetical protein